MSDQQADSSAPIAYHLLIVGRVQGVSYRAHAKAQALRLGLSGWVRNLGSGEVEAVVAGPPQDLAAFVDWAHLGPPNARVTRIDIAEVEIPTEAGFEQLPSA